MSVTVVAPLFIIYPFIYSLFWSILFPRYYEVDLAINNFCSNIYPPSDIIFQHCVEFIDLIFLTVSSLLYSCLKALIYSLLGWGMSAGIFDVLVSMEELCITELINKQF